MRRAGGADGAAPRRAGGAAPEVPSVRGSLFVTGVVAVRHKRDSGAVSQRQLEARLGPEALDRLDEKIDLERWYPVAPFCEMVALDWDLAGGREPEYMRERGRDTADRFFRSGIYQQLDYARRVPRSQTREALVRQAKLVVTVTDALYSFLQTRVEALRDRLEIVFDEAEPFCEGLRYTTEGFMNEVNRRQGASRRWSSDRVAPDRVRFRLPLPEWLHEGD